MLNWDDLRLFLTIARSGKLTDAGRKLGLNHSTLARRLTALEQAVGTRLLDRSPRGVALTAAGTQLLDHVERIESEVLASSGDLVGGDRELSGTVRLATPEAFGTYLVAPNAHLLHQRHPALQLELAPESRSVSLSRREADLAVMLNRPPKGRFTARRLIDYRIGLYASKDYLERCGPVLSVSDIVRHPLASYIDEYIDLPELRYLDQIVTGAPTTFRSSSIAAQQAAVASGLGLGILHVFAADNDPRLVRILPDAVEIKRSYWLVVHEDLRANASVRAVAEFLADLVETNRSQF
jgi:DNA-binding transcriptional LysR family regulator